MRRATSPRPRKRNRRALRIGQAAAWPSGCANIAASSAREKCGHLEALLCEAVRFRYLTFAVRAAAPWPAQILESFMPGRILISDALSPAAIAIFKDRGVEVDFQPALGKDKDKLAAIIGDYDGLAIRSATKVTAEILANAKRLKVIGRAGIGVDNVDIPAATAKGVIVMNTPFGNSITTA